MLARHSWLLAALPIWLASRAFAYALAPAGPLERQLGAETGGPAPLLVGATVVTVALAVACAALWLASLSVRERAALARTEAPPLDVRGLVLRGAVLFVVASIVFTGVELWLHVRAGVGFHGLECLTGDVHRDALPFLAAFSVAATSVLGALARIVRWARRTLALLRVCPPKLRPAPFPRAAAAVLPAPLTPRNAGSRAPPCWS